MRFRKRNFFRFYATFFDDQSFSILCTPFLLKIATWQPSLDNGFIFSSQEYIGNDCWHSCCKMMSNDVIILSMSGERKMNRTRSNRSIIISWKKRLSPSGVFRTSCIESPRGMCAFGAHVLPDDSRSRCMLYALFLPPPNIAYALYPCFAVTVDEHYWSPARNLVVYFPRRFVVFPGASCPLVPCGPRRWTYIT